ncbi:unnamed protein product, partial [Rotaria magnacalcarata]
MSSNKQSTVNPQQNFTYKEYQSSSIVSAPPQRNLEIPSKPESLTSIYTFPSLVKTNANWRRPQQQQATYDGSSSST